LLNINIPRGSAWEIRTTRLGARLYEEDVIYRRDPRGREYLWIGGTGAVRHDLIEGSDTDAFDAGIFRGRRGWSGRHRNRLLIHSAAFSARSVGKTIASSGYKVDTAEVPHSDAWKIDCRCPEPDKKGCSAKSTLQTVHDSTVTGIPRP